MLLGAPSAAAAAVSGDAITPRPLQQQLLRPQHQSHHQQVLPLAAVPQQQQQQQQEALLFCTLDARVLTAKATRCRTWQAAAVLFAQQAQCMNHISLAALLCRTAHLPGGPGSRPVNWRAFVRQILAASEPQLHLCGTRELSNMAWALAALGVRDWAASPGACSWSHTWEQQLLAKLAGSSCRDTSNTLWALATSISSSSSDSSGSGSSDFSLRQQHRPLVLQQQQHILASGRLGQELMSALHRQLPNSCPQDVSNALWALATLQLQPSPELSQFLLVRAQSHFSHFKPQEVANLLWAVSELQLQPSSSWVQELLLRQLPGRETWAGQSAALVVCLTACGRLAVAPPNKWVGQCLLRLQQTLLAQGQHETSSSSSCRAAASSSGGSTSDADARTQQVSSSSSDGAAAGSSHRSSSSSRRAQAHAPQDLANTAWALGRLRIRPRPAWMAAFLAASAAQLPRSTPQQLVNTLWGLAKLGVAPDAAWLAAFDTASLAAMDGFTAQGLADVLAAQVHLQLGPSPAWCEVWLVVLQRRWGCADAAAVCKSLWAAARAGVRVGRTWLVQALQEAQPELQRALLQQELQSVELLRLMWAVARLRRGRPLYQQLSDMLALHCCRAAGNMPARQLAAGAGAMAHLRPLPRQQLLDYYCQLAESRRAHMVPEQAEELDKKLQLLRDTAAAAAAAAGAGGGGGGGGSWQQRDAAAGGGLLQQQQHGGCAGETGPARESDCRQWQQGEGDRRDGERVQEDNAAGAWLKGVRSAMIV